MATTHTQRRTNVTATPAPALAAHSPPTCILCGDPITTQPASIPVVKYTSGAPMYTAPAHPLCRHALLTRRWQ